MKVLIGSAAQAQISTMPESDQTQVAAALLKLHDKFSNMEELRRIAPDEDLWEVRVTPDLRAVVQVAKDRAVVIAVARRDQFQHATAQSNR